MIYYQDLLTVPYKKAGRNIDGMDCYGFLIECFKREGKILKDLRAIPEGDIEEYISHINVLELNEYKKGCGIQFTISGKLHVGYMIDKRTVLHMTDKGVKYSAIRPGNGRMFEVIDEHNAV